MIYVLEGDIDLGSINIEKVTKVKMISEIPHHTVFTLHVLNFIEHKVP